MFSLCLLGSKSPPYWRSLHEWMPPLSLLSTSPIVAASQLFETDSKTASSLPKWISPLHLLSTSPIVAAPQFPESASEASSRAAC